MHDTLIFPGKHINMFNSSLRQQHALFLVLVMLTAILVSCNKNDSSESNEKPEGNRFTKVVLTQGFDEPMAMTFTNDGRVLIVERKGGLKVFDTKTNQVKTITTIPVNTKYTSKEGVVSEAEEGLMGIVVHPDFANNHWIYMYYADPVDTKHVKDLDKNTMNPAEVGTGIVDFKRIFDNAKESGMQYFFVEQDQAPQPLQNVTNSFNYLKKMLS